MNFKNTVGMVVLALGLPALAQSRPSPVAPSHPATAAATTVKPTVSLPEVQLSCPTGTKQVGGAKSVFEASLCMRIGRDGSRIFHGPYVAYWPTGQKQAEGQFEDGFRSGKWTFFEENGVKSGETNFKRDDYDGVRVEFYPNGQKKLEETYAMGRRQGAQTMFDVAGKVVSTVHFVDDRPMAK